MKLVKATALSLIALASVVGCSGSNSGGAAAGGAASTWSLSGTMGGLSAYPMSIQEDSKLDTLGYLKNQAIALAAELSGKAPIGSDGDAVSALTNACADGKYYRVLCSAWSVPPVAAYGEVACGGASSGSFTVSGLPLNTDISCAVRKSTDGTTFTPFANLELPATSTIAGGTTTINAAGDMVLGITVGSGGAITTTVTSGDNKADDAVSAAVTPSTLSGYYNVSCSSDLGADNLKLCKCFLFGTDDKETCVASGSGAISDTEKMTINFNVYKGTAGGAGVDLNGDTTVDLAAGANIYGGTIWAAHNGSNAACTSATCTSKRTGAGEGLPTMTNLTWEDTAATAALTWATGTVPMKCGSGTVSVTVGTVPGSSATRTDWLTWLQDIVHSWDLACGHDSSNAWNSVSACEHATNSSYKNDTYCVGNFAWQVLDDAARNSNLPRVRWDFSTSNSCTSSGCTTNTIAASMLMVEGVEFASNGSTTRYMPSPQNRFVFDQFLPNSAGTGGSLKSENEDFRGYPCTTGGTICSTEANTAGAYLECSTSRALTINFIPDGSGNFNMVFDEQTFIKGGKYKGGGSLHNTDGYAACKTALSSGSVSPQFMAKATKLQ